MIFIKHCFFLAKVSCGMLESLLKVIQWPSTELDHITFVTRAVRVIDLITNLDMQSFQTHSGLSCFISRLELEVEHCRKQQPFEIRVGPQRRDSVAEALEEEAKAKAEAGLADESKQPMEVDGPDDQQQYQEEKEEQQVKPSTSAVEEPYLTAPKPGVTCLPQRAALLKSMLNFLKKAIQDPAFSDSIRHVMDGSLPSSLKHIISNAEYYGPSLFLLATDVVTAYVFQVGSVYRVTIQLVQNLLLTSKQKFRFGQARITMVTMYMSLSFEALDNESMINLSDTGTVATLVAAGQGPHRCCVARASRQGRTGDARGAGIAAQRFQCAVPQHPRPRRLRRLQTFRSSVQGNKILKCYTPTQRVKAQFPLHKTLDLTAEEYCRFV